ncbi:MAG: aldehyde dehydrogenase family protein, partial [Bdellovibrionales bacterium]|nr:aldehyde dehydrogenase family protein [Bdellovibrionales bacterium]
QKYTEIDQVIDQINSTEFSFQAALYSSNIQSALHCARRIECRGFMVNNPTAFRVDWMPFGGSKRSGLGLGGVRHSMHEMSEERLVVMRVE